MRRAGTLLAVVGILVLAGCAGLGVESPVATNPTETTTTTPTAQSTTMTDTTSATTTTCEYSCVGDNPDYGTELLSVTETTQANAMEAESAYRADFENLSRERQRVFLAAHERDCNLVQNVFHFSNEDRLRYVEYDGAWYYLRVSIV